MAQNSLRVQTSVDGEPDPVRSRFGSFPMQPPGPEEFNRLQEMLAQALKREAEAHRKMKHLYEQLVDVQSRSPRTRSISDGSQSGTPDILWDSELSQTSEGSPHSPPPAVIVVSDSPARVRKSPSLPAPLSTGNAPQLVSKFFPLPVRQVKLSNGEHYPSSHAASTVHGEQATDSAEKGVEQSTAGTLAPSPQDYRGVLQEREKPPPSLVSTNSQDGPSSPSSPHPVLTSPEASLPIGFVAAESKDQVSEENKVRVHARNSLPPESILRSVSIKEKRKTRGGRSRSNTGNLLSNWMRRKKGGGERPPSPSRALQRHPVDSMAEMFDGFVRVTNTSDQQDTLAMYIDHHWSEVCVESSCSVDVRKYRDAVWDMFQMEAKFLVRFLQPLERVYKGFLEELHFHGILKVADVDKIFANLSELCELSSSVAGDLFQLFEGRSGHMIAPNNELILAFSMFGHKFNPVYQRFCVNFEKQRGFVRALEKLPEFVEYLQVCRHHQSVGKNDLTALLIAPMQHQCHYQLALEKVLKYTKDKAEKELLSSAIKAFVVSLKELEANIAENKRSAEMLELQETLCWPSLLERDPTAYIPEAMMPQLSRQPCSYVLASKDRQLVFNGPVKLLDKKNPRPRDAVAFLFTDSLLLTQQKATQAEKRNVKKEVHNQLTRYCVLEHPLLLTMVDIHNIAPHPNHGHLITLLERNLFQQQVAIYSLQLPTKEDKDKWLSHLQHTQNILSYRNSPCYRESDV